MSNITNNLGKNFKLFKRFKNIDSKCYQQLLDKANIYRQLTKDKSPYDNFTELIYIHKDNYTKSKDFFDKLCLYIILIFDRDALLYNIYLELITSQIGVLEKDNQKPVVLLQKELTQKQREALKSSSIKLFGFYEDVLVEIEKAYFNKFLLSDSLNVSFEQDYFFRILSMKESEFKGISEERINELKEIVSKWFLAYKVKNYHFLLAYQLEEEQEFFNYPTWEEKAIIIILSIDPNLSLLKHYMTNCNLRKTAEYSLDLFGFYYNELIQLEHKYNETYKVITKDPWELMLSE